MRCWRDVVIVVAVVVVVVVVVIIDCKRSAKQKISVTNQFIDIRSPFQHSFRERLRRFQRSRLKS